MNGKTHPKQENKTRKGKSQMKKLLFAVAVCASMMAFSQDAAADAAKCSDSPAAVKDAKAEKAAKRLAAQAKQCKMSVEDFSKLSKAEQKAKIKEARAKADEANAKLCGMTVEEFKALKPADRKAKLKEARRAAKKAKKAKAAE